MLPFEEVVEALGRTGQHDLGLQVVPLDAIVGSVDRAVDFDRGLRPTSARLRSRWERIAPRSGAARRSRRSRTTRSASCTSCATATTACRWPSRSAARTSTPTSSRSRRASRSATTRWSPTCRSRTTSGCSASESASARGARPDALTDPWDYGVAGRGGRGVGLPAMQDRGTLHGPRRGRPPLVRGGVRAGRRDCCSAGDLIADGETETEAYMRVAAYATALRTHEWSDEVSRTAAGAPAQAPTRCRRSAPRCASVPRSLRARVQGEPGARAAARARRLRGFLQRRALRRRTRDRTA